MDAVMVHIGGYYQLLKQKNALNKVELFGSC